MKKGNTGKTKSQTGYSPSGRYRIGAGDLAETTLGSLEISCSAMRGQMKDPEITSHRRASRMRFNVWINGFLVQFKFDSARLQAKYDVRALINASGRHSATLFVVSRVIVAVYEWLDGHDAEDICEAFYEVSEQGIAWNILDAFRRGKVPGRGRR